MLGRHDARAGQLELEMSVTGPLGPVERARLHYTLASRPIDFIPPTFAGRGFVFTRSSDG
jgi:hypothetical protein